MTWKSLIARARHELRLLAWHHLRHGRILDAYQAWANARKLGTRTRIMPPLIFLPRYHDWVRRRV